MSEVWRSAKSCPNDDRFPKAAHQRGLYSYSTKPNITSHKSSQKRSDRSLVISPPDRREDDDTTIPHDECYAVRRVFNFAEKLLEQTARKSMTIREPIITSTFPTPSVQQTFPHFLRSQISDFRSVVDSKLDTPASSQVTFAKNAVRDTRSQSLILTLILKSETHGENKTRWQTLN